MSFTLGIMSTIAINELYAMLMERLTPEVRGMIDMKVAGDSGLQIKIDGENCLTSIGVWPNGCCDIDFLYSTSEKGEFKHFEFQNTSAAVSPVLREIWAATERARCS